MAAPFFPFAAGFFAAFGFAALAFFGLFGFFGDFGAFGFAVLVFFGLAGFFFGLAGAFFAAFGFAAAGAGAAATGLAAVAGAAAGFVAFFALLGERGFFVAAFALPLALAFLGDFGFGDPALATALRGFLTAALLSVGFLSPRRKLPAAPVPFDCFNCPMVTPRFNATFKRLLMPLASFPTSKLAMMYFKIA